jgi:hypothetical protein
MGRKEEGCVQWQKAICPHSITARNSMHSVICFCRYDDDVILSAPELTRYSGHLKAPLRTVHNPYKYTKRPNTRLKLPVELLQSLANKSYMQTYHTRRLEDVQVCILIRSRFGFLVRQIIPVWTPAAGQGKLRPHSEYHLQKQRNWNHRLLTLCLSLFLDLFTVQVIFWYRRYFW